MSDRDRLQPGDPTLLHSAVPVNNPANDPGNLAGQGDVSQAHAPVREFVVCPPDRSSPC